MDGAEINSKINKFNFNLCEQIRSWLKRNLPTITDKWWNEMVINKLTSLQRRQVEEKHIKNLSGLDLASLLQVIDQNWFLITKHIFMNNRERGYIQKMQEIRNSWAHITPEDITSDKIIDDLEIIENLMAIFGTNEKDKKDLQEFIKDIQKGIFSPKVAKSSIKTSTLQVKESPKTNVNVDSEIVIGSVVNLVADPSKIGAVINIDGNNYSVLINNSIQSFFREQIQLHVSEPKKDFLPLRNVRTALTAYQINNPSSSNLYSLNAARIDFVPYQFRPALKLIQSDSPRILIADDVGVGKTIEAGLILKELEARSRAESVLIICPRPLVAERKWESEMLRFDEEFTSLDGNEFRNCIQKTDRDGIWPIRNSKVIIPYSLFKEDIVNGSKGKGKKSATIGLTDLDPFPHFNLVIVDEAHNIRNSNTWAYKGVELFCRNADAVVFMTATPLQNSNDDLYTLLNLLRPDLILNKTVFKSMSEPNPYINHLIKIVREQRENWQKSGKTEIKKILQTSWGMNVIKSNPVFEDVVNYFDKENVTREEKVAVISKIEELHSFNAMLNRTRRRDIEDFCIRRNQTINIKFSDIQKDLYDSLMKFEGDVLSLKNPSVNIRFMMCTIMRQASSCIYGLAPFMEDIVNHHLEDIQDLTLEQDDIDIIDIEAENYLVKLAKHIIETSKNFPDDDPKFNQMLKIVKDKQKMKNKRIILFSSFRHTLAYIRKKLKMEGLRVAQIDGSVPDEERYELRRRFMADHSEEDAIDMLLFSEVGGEGLDYQFCDTMINYDLPWNPMRIEQRIGRIDRRGQKSEAVQIYNMITEDTIDAAIYEKCLLKIGVFEDSIGDCSEILGAIANKISQIMLDPTLTEEERKAKLEQSTNNEIKKLQTLRSFEDKQKNLYGFDLSSYIMDQSVQEAENAWICPQSIQNLLEVYFEDFLGSGDHIIVKRETRTKQEAKILLRLDVDERRKLLKELVAPTIKNSDYQHWQAYLKADKPNISNLEVTFNSDYAKDHLKVTFLTQMHPLIMQAAKYESANFPMTLSIKTSNSGLKPGKHAFLIYAWKYVGLRPDIKLKAISQEKDLSDSILSIILREAELTELDKNYDDVWNELNKIHLASWQEAKNDYVQNVTEECQYRIEQLNHSYQQQEAIIQNQLNNAENANIQRMKNYQLENLRRKHKEQKESVEELSKKIDIYHNLLIKGVLYAQ